MELHPWKEKYIFWFKTTYIIHVYNIWPYFQLIFFSFCMYIQWKISWLNLKIVVMVITKQWKFVWFIEDERFPDFPKWTCILCAICKKCYNFLFLKASSQNQTGILTQWPEAMRTEGFDLGVGGGDLAHGSLQDARPWSGQTSNSKATRRAQELRLSPPRPWQH